MKGKFHARLPRGLSTVTITWIGRTETIAHVELAQTFWQRLRGLLGRRPLAANEGLLISPCNSVHSFFMRVAIDVVFLDKSGTVVSINDNFSPWRFALCWKAHHVLELAAHEAQRLGLRPGDQYMTRL